MLRSTKRREFLRTTALASSLLPLSLRAQSKLTPPPATTIARLENLLPKLMAESLLLGLAIAIVQNGNLLWTRGFGFKEISSKDPVDENTVFEAASVSKTVFAYAVLKLCEKGILDLDTPLTKYSPRPFLQGDPRLDLITPRHVLSHTTGFQDWRSGDAPLKIHFTPGTKFLYSGEGYYYLQSIITHLTGKIDRTICANYEADLEVCATDIDDYLKRTLLVPFGMTSSGYLWNDTFQKQAARPHDSSGKPVTKKKPAATDAARYASAGGLHTTATDYAKFLIEILNPKKSDAFRLSQSSVKEMLRPQIKLTSDQKIDGATSWALGWAIQERETGNFIVHSGGQQGFRSLAMASPERKSAFIILTNGDSGGKVLYHQDLLRILDTFLVK